MEKRTDRRIAYFSMEIALEPKIPTYSGGLGILAGDTLRSAADLKVPMVGVSLLHRKGYFTQRLDPSGWQTEQPVEWNVEQFLQEMPDRTQVTIEGRNVTLRAWGYEVQGVGESTVPVFLLDSDLPENSEWDRTLTHFLYGGDARYRLAQEVILGIGGVKMLRALGYDRIARFHMNEGHAALLTLALLDERAVAGGRWPLTPEDIEEVRGHCVFTTHTPVAAGHDQFPMDLATSVIDRKELNLMQDVLCSLGNMNLTYLALNLSRYVNGVAKKHGEVSRLKFAHHSIDAITNGVHAGTWTSAPFQELFDRHIPGWREDNFSLRSALNIPMEEVWSAHVKAKRRLIETVKAQGQAPLNEEVFTIGFARRATAYKRADLFFRDMERLKRIASSSRPIQILYAGKAHPQDHEGKESIKRIFQVKEALRDHIPTVYLENYDMELAQWITAGVDLWLNTPQPPLEASGTSGMKAALNGVPSLSVLDGWWIEGHIEGVTGWAIGALHPETSAGEDRGPQDAASLYDKLEQVVLPMYYQNRDLYLDVMLHAIALNGSFFNTQRMVQQYVVNAYFR